MRISVLLLIIVSVSPATQAADPVDDIELAGIFGDHMVLQRNQPILIHGRAPAGARFVVTFDAQARDITASSSGTWSVEFAARDSGGPFELTVRTAEDVSRRVTDILIGDVYLCSGQSNMEMPVSRVRSAPAEIGRQHDPAIRQFRVRYAVSPVALAEFSRPSEWAVAAKDSIESFSAACYFFAREIRKTSDVPIGLVNASWGGSQIEAWIGERHLRGIDGMAESLDILNLFVDDESAAQAALGQQWQDWWQRLSGGATPWVEQVARTDEWLPVPRLTSWKDYGDPMLAAHDGMVWYRRAFELDAAQADMPATLSFGKVEKSNVVWVNGHFVGRTVGWAPTRQYEVSANVLRPGTNQVLVSVTSHWGNGGFTTGAEHFTLRPRDGEAVSLADTWQYRKEPRLDYFEPTIPWGTTFGLTGMYNAMIAPLRGYSIRAAIWYQGESNTRRATQYRELLHALIRNWREDFGDELPFVIVQLPEFGSAPLAPTESAWSNLREAQRRGALAMPGAGLVVAMGLGDPTDIHPTNKQDLGRRIASVFHGLTNGGDAAIDGHAPRRVLRRGSDVVIEFDSRTGDLQTRSSDHAIAFELCGDGPGECVFADTEVDGSLVVLKNDKITQPKRVRYCWGNSPTCNLFAGDGTPIGPFELSVN